MERLGAIPLALNNRATSRVVATPAALSDDTGLAPDRVADAVRALVRDGVVHVTPGPPSDRRVEG